MIARQVTDARGELGIPTSVVGTVAQALGAAVVDREHATREQVIEYLSSDKYDESHLWSVVGPLIDEIEDTVLGPTRAAITFNIPFDRMRELIDSPRDGDGWPKGQTLTENEHWAIQAVDTIAQELIDAAEV